MEEFNDLVKMQQEKEKLAKQIEAISQEFKDFVYIISHDLKAPLRAISALTDWISADYADKFDNDGKEQLKLLVSRVNRMQNLMDGVLQYSRIGRVQEERVPIDLNKFLPELIETINPPAKVKITVENQMPTVCWEPTRIRQIFENLLSNAIRFNNKAECLVKIGYTEEDGFWKFSISDNGPGIAEQHFEKIFRIFQTLQAKDQFETTGVGLTIAKKIVETYGGKIWLSSTIGQGTTFFFTLPKTTSENKNPEKIHQPQTAGA